MSPESDSKREVDARRRRRTDPPAGQERKQAPAPQRRRSRSGQQPASTGTGTNLSGSPGGKKLPGWAAVLILIVFVLFYIFSSSGGDGSSEPVSDLPGGQNNLPDTSLNAPQPTSPPFELPAAMPDAPVWLVMLYQDADDKILEQDILLDFNEAERIGSSPNVHIVSQLDRFNGGYQGDGDWRTTKRFYITQDLDLSRIGSEELADLGEVNMADGDTLVDFVTWAVQNFPADKYVLILSDHGMGWPGGWSDPAPGGRGDPDIPLAARLGDELYLMELDQALTDIRDQTGIEKFELIGMDACLMGHVEVFSALAPHARYAVASQETEPALGWAYTGFLEALIANPDMDGSELGEQIVSSYIDNDQRIVDDQARAEFLRQGSPMGSIFDLLLGGSPSTMDADQLAQQLGQGITLTAADLESLPELTASLNQFALALQNSDQSVIARARNYAQSFTSVFGREVPPSYIDLGNFVSLLLQESNDSELSRAGARLLQAIDQVVIAEKHGPKKPGATGLSIYFPNSSLFSNPIAGPDSYVAIANRFAEETLWDEFLVYHYTGNNFEAGSRGTT
ncbi:MAG: hypothetical protein JW862_03025, partial [Anaerolineales bacterium]|nr:hypothetical protein [Anaerolineales bacterium]